MKQHGDTVAGKKIEIIRKDTGGIEPAVAKRLARGTGRARQGRHPRRLPADARSARAAGVSAEAKKFMVIMNAATSIIADKSPYFVRISFTLPMVARRSATGRPRRRRQEGLHDGVGLRPRHRRRDRFSKASRPAAARSSARCAWRSPIRTSRPSSSAPRTSTRKRSSCSSRAARSRRRSARRLPNAASTPRRSRSWAPAN